MDYLNYTTASEIAVQPDRFHHRSVKSINGVPSGNFKLPEINRQLPDECYLKCNNYPSHICNHYSRSTCLQQNNIIIHLSKKNKWTLNNIIKKIKVWWQQSCIDYYHNIFNIIKITCRISKTAIRVLFSWFGFFKTVIAKAITTIIPPIDINIDMIWPLK